MDLVIGLPIINQQQLTNDFFAQIRKVTTGEVPIIIVDNGSDIPCREWLIGLEERDIVIRNEENVGLVKALNQIYQVAKGKADYIVNLHNDVIIYEERWDEKVERILSEVGNVGVAGFYGAKAIGTPGIYQAPYQMQQMVRMGNVSGCHRMDASVHGYRRMTTDWEDVAVMDGFSLIVSMELLNKTGGYDRNYPPHHMYDNDICLESLDKGYRNIVIDMDAQHLGGRTDVGENWEKPFGKSKAQIHQDAHPIFYEKWRPGKHNIHLPVQVR